MDERKVKRIYHPPAVPAADLFKGGKQRRVAAYARVSTASDEQLNSVEAQKDYFDKLIRPRPDWIFVGVYADEGITGTSINRREAFNRMVTDALAGDIALIVTKSISRFARNTVDTLNTIRQLKAANVEVFFEKENIYTMDSKGEFLITLLSSIAEEESRSISENVKWGQRKRFADGKYSVPYKHFRGYRKGANGIMEIIPILFSLKKVLFPKKFDELIIYCERCITRCFFLILQHSFSAHSYNFPQGNISIHKHPKHPGY